jgi:hypothetical protein
VDAQSDPSLFADVGRAEEASIFEENAVKQFPYFQANAEFAFVFFHNEEDFLVNAKGGVAEAESFRGSGQA